MPPKKKKARDPAKPFGSKRAGLKCFSPQISEWLCSTFFNSILFPKVLVFLISDFLCPTVTLYLTHRPWEARICEVAFYILDLFVPTIGDPSIHHWSEKVLEVYADKTFLPLLFPTKRFTVLHLEDKEYYVFDPSTHPNEVENIYKFCLWRKNWRGRHVYWLMVPREDDDQKSIEAWEGKPQRFYAKLLNEVWECSWCTVRNQLAQHACEICKKERIS